MNVEKINEGKNSFFNRIRKSLLGKIATYSLAVGFAFVTFAMGCERQSPIKKQELTTKIVFRSGLHSDETEIYVMGADGSNKKRLTKNHVDDESPAWSPEGTKIAFHSNRDGNYEIYVMDADGSGFTNLTNNPEGDYEPDWSPDGTKIAFASYRDGNKEIYVMNADGSNQTKLTNNPATDEDPAWSPDGKKIAFESLRDKKRGKNSEIYVMNVDGSGQTNLTNQTYDEGDPAWSPDGSKIVYRSGNRLFVMNSNGSNKTYLHVIGHDPAWSPDGSKIVFAREKDFNYDIYIMNADGTGLTNLTNSPAKNEYEPDWSP